MVAPLSDMFDSIRASRRAAANDDETDYTAIGAMIFVSQSQDWEEMVADFRQDITQSREQEIQYWEKIGNLFIHCAQIFAQLF